MIKIDNFVFHNPTQLIFGHETMKELRTLVPRYGKKVLFTYGGGSIKKNDIYEQILSLLKEAEIEVFELPGIEPNPRLTTVQKGIQLCRDQQIDFLLAVGGGSVIDATKAIAVGARYDGDVWDIITRQVVPSDALPFGTVLTLAATGSEMNSGSVITNWETKQKIGWGSPLVFPVFSILDPVNTITVPKEQTIYGVVDIMSHVLEQYFSNASNIHLQRRWMETLLTTMIETAPRVLLKPNVYEYRETMLLCGTMALNGVLKQGLQGDWATHIIEHELSAHYDIPHGGGLAILFPNWIRYCLPETIPHMKQLAVRVFGVETAGKTDVQIAKEGIDCLRLFWTSIEAPKCLADYGIGGSKLPELAQNIVTTRGGSIGNLRKLREQDVLDILTMSL